MSGTGWKALSALPLKSGYVVFTVLCKILATKLNSEHAVPLQRYFSITLQFFKLTKDDRHLKINQCICIITENT
jgi:hypothetical protein